MNRFAIWASAGLAALAAPSVYAKPIPPTIEQLAAFAKFESFSVSPDGKHLAALEAFGEDRHILVWSTANLKAPPVEFGSRDMKLVSVRFVKNDVLAATLWQPYEDHLGATPVSTFATRLLLVDLDGRNWREAILRERGRSDFDERVQALYTPRILSALPGDPDHILVSSSDDIDTENDIYRVNVHTMAAERIERSPPGTQSHSIDLAGRPRARNNLGQDGRGTYVGLQIRPAAGGAWETVNKSYVKDRDVYNIVGFTEDPNIAVLASNVGEDKIALYEYDIAAHKQGEVLFKHKMFDAAGAIPFAYPGSAIAKQGELIGVSYNGPNGSDVVWTHPAFIALDKQVRAALGIEKTPVRLVDPATGAEQTTPYDATRHYRILEYSQDLAKVLVELSGSSTPPRTYLVADGKITQLAESHPDIDPASLGDTRLVYYKARDGLTIPAFLTTPNTEMCGAGPWPAVIHPHGGPWARDEAEFDWFGLVPLMASRCYAVLRPQYRGSDGWGRLLWKAGDAEWGQKMQDDKDDGAKWLIDQKLAIPGRIAMFGFSYGGYASMVAAIRPNGLYKCAIAGAGVSDINKIWAGYYDEPYFREHQASTVKGLNPVDHASEIKIPIMVYQGMRDTTVPPVQSQWFVAKARKSTQPVEYHEIKDFAHGPAWTRAIQAEHLHLVEDYLKKGCAGGL